MDKQLIFKEITDYYLNSKDCNGLPIYNMSNYNYDFLCELIDEDMIEVLSESDIINPHVRLFDLKISKEQQKNIISNKENYVVLYPSRKALENLTPDYDAPYTEMMRKGAYQFKIIYFDIEVLERYFNNPNFIIADYGYRGKIYLNNEEDNIEYEYIKDYGMSYMKGEQLIRAIGVFVSDLAKLPPQKQFLWKSNEHKNQKNYIIHHGFVDNLVKGEWVDFVWIYDALLEEMKVINKQCEAIGIPKIFSKTFGTHFSEKPNGYRHILLPTIKNFNDFVMVLEKMVIHNISYKAFTQKASLVKSVDRKDNNGKPKGTLQLLSEWLKLNVYNIKEDIDTLIVASLRNIRKIRQIPAHELTENRYDLALYEKQEQLMHETYKSIRYLRLILANHPLAKNVEINDYLYLGDKIIDC